MTRRFLSWTALVGLVAIGWACSKEDGAAAPICTAGNFTTCKCPNGQAGTRLCREDELSFEDCKLPGGEACPGSDGTEPDDDDVSGDDDPIPGDDDDDTTVEKDGGTVISTNADKCPGQVVNLQAGATITVNGSTESAANDSVGKAGGACAVATGSDHVYQLTTTTTGTVTVKLQGLAPYDPTLYIRRTCDNPDDQAGCGETTAAGGTETLNVPITAGTPIFAVVDGKNASKGTYSLSLTLKAGTVCGDGIVDTGEACDDKNKVEDDGCSNSCKQPNGNPPSGGSCPGHPVHLWGGAAVTATGSTNDYPNTFTNPGTSCSNTTTNTSNDHIYAVTAHKAGALTVKTTGASYNVVLSARTTCNTASTQGATTCNAATPSLATGMCANCNGGTTDEQMTFNVTNGQTVYVAVDGALGAKGTYNISFSLP